MTDYRDSVTGEQAATAREVPAPPPETKDWTWVLQRRCPDCGLDASSIRFEDVAPTLLADVPGWQRLLSDAAVARRRPEPLVWSPLEYACHVRDVCLLFRERMDRMLAEPDPLFANWDQDSTAVADRYDLQDPSVVAVQLSDAAAAMARRLRDVRPEQYDRPGRRSDGSVFTVDSLARYFLHDVVHHAWDVGLR